MTTETLDFNNVYHRAFIEALELIEMSEDLEHRSALKQAASYYGIAEGEDLGKFVKWAEKYMYGE
jgi:hypothetical protein|tara:strand:+ start:3052 stop:3246 length:195 start_codon:yes stop_codon:yes gene_type:complete